MLNYFSVEYLFLILTMLEKDNGEKSSDAASIVAIKTRE
jgi:hypothetical protein